MYLFLKPFGVNVENVINGADFYNSCGQTKFCMILSKEIK